MELADEQRAQAMAADGKITIEQARRIVKASKGPLAKVFAGAVVGGTIGVLVFLIGWCMKPKTAEERALDRCTIEAQLAGKAGGNPNFKYARAESSTEAKLWFSKNGVYWSTTYFCD